MRVAVLIAISLSLTACGQGADPADTKGADLSVPADLAALPDLAPGTVYTVFIRGKLRNDVATSKTIHDQIVSNGEATAKMLGDIAHYTFLNVYPPGDGGVAPPSDQFLGIDQWTNLGGFMTFTSDPNVQAAFGNLFEGAPTFTVGVEPTGWTEWGMLDPLSQGTPLYLFSVRAPLSASTTAQSLTAHNAITAGFMAKAMQAGDVGHRVFLGQTDMTQFQSIDLWTSIQAATAVYSDPNLQSGFATLFSAAPTIEPYVHSDWAQY